MRNYSTQSTLLEALRRADIQMVRRCLRAGQSLNQKVKYNRYMFEKETDVPLIHYISQKFSPESFLTLMVFHKQIDLNAIGYDGKSLLYELVGNIIDAYSCTQRPTQEWFCFHLVLQRGIKLDIDALRMSSGYYMTEVLLACGIDPGDITLSRDVKRQATKWLVCLYMAEKILREIFDGNTALVGEVSGFVYNKDFLKKAIS